MASGGIRYGISRGVFSNEAGFGTLGSPLMDRQNISRKNREMWAMFSVFFDTVVLCSLTALVILCTTQGDTKHSLTGAALAAACFLHLSHSCLIVDFHVAFCFCHCDRMVLPGTAGNRRSGSLFFQNLSGLIFRAVFAGGCIRLEAVWMLSDLWNGLMAFFNLTALF